MSEQQIDDFQVFISYTHDSPAHRDWVLELSDRLRADGIDCQLDQYEIAPPAGWNLWSSRCIEDARFVLVVCTETYYRRAQGKETHGIGLGAIWESMVISQELFDAAANNTKFIPILAAADDKIHIPVYLRGATRYLLFDEYDNLYRHITNQPLTPKPAPGKRRHLPPRDRKTSFDGINDGDNRQPAAAAAPSANAAPPVAASNATTADAAAAQASVLRFHVVDADNHPVKGVVLDCKSYDKPSKPTNDAGKTQLVIPPVTPPGSWMELQVLKSKKAGEDWILLSPWNGRVSIPSLDGVAGSVVSIVVAKKFDRHLLANDKALAAITASVLHDISPKTSGEPTTEEEQRDALAEVAEKYGLETEALDKAIRAWGERAQDPYEIGLAAIYERKYAEASAQLSKSLELREEELEQKKAEVADAAFFLGQSLYEQGKYRESVTAYRKAAEQRPDDATTLNNLALSLTMAASYAEAEPLYQRALAIKEKALGADHPSVATTLNNLAELYRSQGKFADAEPLYQRDLEISENALGADHPDVATTLNNLALLYESQGKYADAEPLYQRALAIYENALGADHPSVAITLNNLAALYESQGKIADAEPLYQRSLAIRENALGADHPSVAITLNNLALLYESQGKYADAEPLYQRSLAILDKAFAEVHPNIATLLENYAGLLRTLNREGEAVALEKRAKAIRDKLK